jgi:chorismate mutase-like protein
MLVTSKLNKLLIGSLCCVAFSQNVFAGECNTKKLDDLFATMAARSALMEGVAAYKFINKQTVYDAPRELKVLQNTQDIAKKNKIDSGDLMVFAQIQMDQAKFIQDYWIARWNANTDNQPDPEVTPGIDSLRKQINALDDKIYTQLINNLSDIEICNQPTILKHLDKAFANVKGIPQNPAYNQLTASAIANLSIPQ